MAVAFGVFQNRNFRLFWIGMLISMMGTIIQITAQSWLVLELTNSPFMMGLIGAAHATPFLIFSLVGGNTADRFDKRKLLYFTQSTMMILAFILGLLVSSGKVAVWHVALIAAGMGTANSFDIPTRQAFVYELVGKKDILSAVSLNSILFNLAQIIGPAIAGIVIASLGNAWCFFLNSISFLAFIVALAMMVITTSTRREMSGSTLKNIMNGLRYAWTSSTLKVVITIASLASVFIAPFGILIPIFARDILKVGSKGFGLMMMSSGIGALFGGLILASIGNIKKKGRLLFMTTLLISVVITLFSFSRIFYLSCFLLVISGFFMLFQNSTLNTLVQLNASDEMRGRIMGIFSLAFMGLSPLGNLQIGITAQFFGATFAITLGTAIFALTTFFILRYTPHLREI